MPTQLESDSHYLTKHPQWFFVGGSLIAAAVALIAEGPGDYIGLGVLAVCVAAVCLWSLTGHPSLYWTIVIVAVALLILGWTVEDPEPALFQSILIAAAVGWRVENLTKSLLLLIFLALVPLLGCLGQGEYHWGWWNWSAGTVLTWTLGRVIRLLDQTLKELTEARAQLIDSAAREERLRISRDVHDLVGHSLTAMLLNIRAALRALDTDHEETRQALTDAERIGTTGMADIRAALVDLRSDTLLGTERAEALSSLPDGDAIVQLLEQQSHINVTLHGDIRQLQGPLAVAIHRVLQECITNCSKYALKDTATVTLNVRADEVVLMAENAFSANQITPPPASVQSIGLISMRERVTSLGGSFSSGAIGNRWQINCRIPRYD